LLLLHISVCFVPLWLIPHSNVVIINLWIHGMCVCVCVWERERERERERVRIYKECWVWNRVIKLITSTLTLYLYCRLWILEETRGQSTYLKTKSRIS
jgi:hypothetical protein